MKKFTIGLLVLAAGLVGLLIWSKVPTPDKVMAPKVATESTPIAPPESGTGANDPSSNAAAPTPIPPPQMKYEKVESEITVRSGGDSLHLSDKVQTIRRYLNSDGQFTMSKISASDELKEDLVLGKVDKSAADGAPIYLCPGKTTDGHGYSYLSQLKDCGMANYKAQMAFKFQKQLLGNSYMPVASCVTPHGNKYATLSAMCEKPEDKVVEFLGYILAAKVDKI